MKENVLFDSSDSKVEGASTDKVEKKKAGGESKVFARYRANPLTLTVFRSEYDDGGESFQYQLQRAYTPDNGETFKYTESLRPRDLRKAARLLVEAADDVENVRSEKVE